MQRDCNYLLVSKHSTAAAGWLLAKPGSLRRTADANLLPIAAGDDRSYSYRCSGAGAASRTIQNEAFVASWPRAAATVYTHERPAEHVAYHSAMW